MSEPHERRTFAVSELDEAALNRLIAGAVVPRPIAWVGTQSLQGTRNLAPFSFFNVVATTPPHLVVGMGVRGGREKDSLANVLATGELTVSIVDTSLIGQMNLTSSMVPSDVDEFELAGVPAAQGTEVDAPMPTEAPVSFECRLRESVRLADDPDADHYVLIIVRIVRIHVRASLLDDRGRIDQGALDAVARMGGPVYSTTRDRFELDRPSPPS